MSPKKSFILHNGAYISFIIYLIYGKNDIDYILLIYYFIGIIQNLIIIGNEMRYYKKIIPPAFNTFYVLVNLLGKFRIKTAKSLSTPSYLKNLINFFFKLNHDKRY